MIERIFKNWKSTTLGVGAIIASFVLVYLEKTTLSEVSLFLGGGFMMIFLKDKNE
jgi:hypothetical protein